MKFASIWLLALAVSLGALATPAPTTDYCGRSLQTTPPERAGLYYQGSTVLLAKADGSVWRQEGPPPVDTWDMVIAPTCNNFAAPSAAAFSAPALTYAVTYIPTRTDTPPVGTPTPFPWLPEVQTYLFGLNITP